MITNVSFGANSPYRGAWVEANPAHRDFPVGASSHAICISSITGLEPVNTTIGSSPTPLASGEIYSGFSQGARNMVVTIPLHDIPGKTVAQTRQEIYQMFAAGVRHTMTITSDGQLYRTEVFCESIESSNFEAEPKMVISLRAPNPFFETVGVGKTYVFKSNTINPTVAQAVLNEMGSAPSVWTITVTLPYSISASGEIHLFDGVTEPLVLGNRAWAANDKLTIQQSTGDISINGSNIGARNIIKSGNFNKRYQSHTAHGIGFDITTYGHYAGPNSSFWSADFSVYMQRRDAGI